MVRKVPRQGPLANPMSVYAAIQDESVGSPIRRHRLIDLIGAELGGRCVVSYFTSFRYPVMMDLPDADILEDVLRLCDISHGLTLVINSPGGRALAAEKIVEVCRTYSDGDFEVIVAHRAKSAATMVCMGARKILMGETAELGPIDPQILHPSEKGAERISADSFLKSYRELLEAAVNCGDKNLAPYLQQLAHFYPPQVKEIEKSQVLAEKVAVALLKEGMLAADNEQEIKKKIRPFLDPAYTVDHGRKVTRDFARECGLNIGDIDRTSVLGELVWELYVRTNTFVAGPTAKALETTKHTFVQAAGR